MTATASFFDFQLPLQGIPPAARSDGRLLLVPLEQDQAGTALIPGQLRLGDEQIQLQPVEPTPVQLGMLPEPPPWDLPDPQGRKKVNETSSTRPSRRAVIPGQVTLF